MLLVLERFATRHRLIAIVRDWHPILLFPLFYKEVERLAAAFGDWRLTSVIPELEAKLFAGQPSMYLSERWNLVLLSEFLHFCYLSYVIIIPAVAGYWYMTNRRVAFHELVLLLTTAMLGSYLFLMLFPVDSPYYLAPRLGAPLAGTFLQLRNFRSRRRAAELSRARTSPAQSSCGWSLGSMNADGMALTPVVLG